MRARGEVRDWGAHLPAERRTTKLATLAATRSRSRSGGAPRKKDSAASSLRRAAASASAAMLGSPAMASAHLRSFLRIDSVRIFVRKMSVRVMGLH